MKITTKILTRSAIVLALAIAVQMVRMPQFLTGPLVNALLLLAVALISPVAAVLVGLCTPVIAFFLGIMPLAPVIPVVMLGNASLAVTFGLLRNKPVLGVAAAAVIKYIAMTVCVKFIVPLFIQKALPPKIIGAMTTPQLLTALAGGVLALLVLQALHWLGASKDIME